MKKFFPKLLLIFLLFMIGCNTVNVSFINKKKPFNFYYTNELAKNIYYEPSFSCRILDTNLYKEKILSDDDINLISLFLKELKSNNFIPKDKIPKTKPAYKMFLTFSKTKFVINVYDDKYISIFPWDGDYSPDYIDITNISIAYNLYHLCRYTILKRE